jgi:hypothetical protein
MQKPPLMRHVAQFTLYAVQQCASGRWLVRAPSGDPFEPAVVGVAVLTEPLFASFPGWFDVSRRHLDRPRAAQELE